MLGDQTPGKRNWRHRTETQKKLAKERGEEISDKEAKLRAIARLHDRGG